MEHLQSLAPLPFIIGQDEAMMYMSMYVSDPTVWAHNHQYVANLGIINDSAQNTIKLLLLLIIIIILLA